VWTLAAYTSGLAADVDYPLGSVLYPANEPHKILSNYYLFMYLFISLLLLLYNQQSLWMHGQVSLMDRAGRRPLLLYPMAAMVVILAVITVAIKYQVR